MLPTATMGQWNATRGSEGQTARVSGFAGGGWETWDLCFTALGFSQQFRYRRSVPWKYAKCQGVWFLPSSHGHRQNNCRRFWKLICWLLFLLLRIQRNCKIIFCLGASFCVNMLVGFLSSLHMRKNIPNAFPFIEIFRNAYILTCFLEDRCVTTLMTKANI